MPLVQFLADRLHVSRRRAKLLLDAHRVLVDGQRIWMAQHRLARHNLVEVLPGKAPVPTINRDRILFANDGLVILNKPAGILSVGKTSAEAGLRTLLRNDSICAVHRLDRDTSGCMLFGIGERAREALVGLFRLHAVGKVYHAIVAGTLSRARGTLSRPVENAPARTHYEVIRSGKSASHLRLTIATGRTHQIRQHCLSIGHPVLGDRSYGTSRRLSAAERQVPRQMLHATSLAFRDPLAGGEIHVKAGLPPDFKACLKLFGL